MLGWQIDKSLKPPKIRLWLCRPNKTTIARLGEAFEIKLDVKLGQINELTFSLPYKVERNNKLTRNPYIDLIRERYLIKAKYGKAVEWFIITKPHKISDEEKDNLTIQCYSRGYELSYKRIRGYQKQSINCLQVLQDCLSGTNWTVNEISDELNLMFRSFEVSSKTRLEFLFEICETYGGLPIFDTDHRKISILLDDQIGENKGFRVKYGKLLHEVEYETDLDKVCTRLHCYGQNRRSIQGVSLLGTSYIDDFSYFLYPFERDENRHVLKSSHYMSDGLCHAILDHQKLLQDNLGEFNEKLLQTERLQIQRSAKQIELFNLQVELKQILDEIYVKTQAGENTSSLIASRDAKQTQVDNKQKEIDDINTELENLDKSIIDLKNSLSYSNNFTLSQLDELNDYILEKEFVNESIVHESDLVNEGRKYLEEINTPPIDVRVKIANFYQNLEEQRKWDLLQLGDYVTVQHEKLLIDIKTKVVGIHFDFEEGEIEIEISNGKELIDDEQQFIKELYKALFSTGDWQSNKHNLQSIALNFNRRNDRNSTTPAKPTIKNDGTAVQHVINDDSSADVSFEWDYTGAGDAYNIDGFIIYLYSSSVNDTYTFGSAIAKEQIFNVTPDKRGYIVSGIPANRWYTFGVQAYRRVDNDIHPSNMLTSDIVKSVHPTENPYQPSSNVEFNGDISGSIGGIDIGDISKVQAGVYTGSGSNVSRTINLTFTPKQVTIFGGHQQSNVQYNARFELTSNKAFITNTNNQSSESSDLKYVTNGFVVGNSNNLANVDNQLYEWVAYG